MKSVIAAFAVLAAASCAPTPPSAELVCVSQLTSTVVNSGKDSKQGTLADTLAMYRTEGKALIALGLEGCTTEQKQMAKRLIVLKQAQIVIAQQILASQNRGEPKLNKSDGARILSEFDRIQSEYDGILATLMKRHKQLLPTKPD